MKTQLSFHALSFSYPARPVFRDLDFSVRPGERLAVIGENGSGKSTLLRLLAGDQAPASGTAIRQAAGGIGYLPQQPEYDPGWSVASFQAHALAPVRELETRLASAAEALSRAREDQLPAALEEYARLAALHEARDGAGAARRLATSAHRLGLGNIPGDRPLSTLSGGELSRLALASALAANPEVLLLDEPTNNLDADALAWLEKRLAGHRGTVVFCTHERLFLRRVADAIIELDDGAVMRHADGYDGYLRAKAAQRRAMVRSREQWEEDLATAARLAERSHAAVAGIPRKAEKPGFGHGAFRARDRTHGSSGALRRANTRMEQLQANEAPAPVEPLHFMPGPLPGRLADPGPGPAAASGSSARGESLPAIRIQGLRVPGRLSIDHLLVPEGGRLLVTGANGAGKSTLLDAISGMPLPGSGSCVARGPVGYLRQQPTVFPALWMAAQAFCLGSGQELADDVAQLLSLGLFRPAELLQRIDSMSLGQRRRLDVARLFARPAEVLLLDEPTNHLSPALADELELALESFAGTVVLVSHDRALQARFSGCRIHLDKGRIVP
ncbi:ABC-F family ATP-binding cassette domain-containing protein [Paeniglutamicibacter sp. NPDC091659]|uniref:ABC-F family ATP-binding cassette domain-containing protein n=1 Tax=Paeniglutamicibacter sp. NPDC091659 TaxID=3364389 RepID=UPI003823430B